MEIILALIALNCVSFLMMVLDKSQAIKRRWRISEQSFFILAALGGWLGIFVAMRTIHHKNKKTSFLFKILLGMGISLVVVGMLFKG